MNNLKTGKLKENFKYLSKWDKIPLKQRIKVWYSNRLFGLSRTILFRKLGFKYPNIFGDIIAYDDDLLINSEKKLPKKHSLVPLRFCFFDIIPLEDLDQFKNKFLSLISSYKDLLIGKDAKAVMKIFNEFESNYKGISSGVLNTIDFTNNPDFDLIDYISFNYIKGSQSTLVLEYGIEPSKKFIDKYNELIIRDSREFKIIYFNGIKKTIKTKRLIDKTSHHMVRSSDLLNRLIQDLNFQVKSKIGAKLEVGYFQKNQDHLYPCISILEVNKDEFHENCKTFHRSIGINEWDDFTSNSLIINLPYPKLSNKPFENLTITFLKNDENNMAEDADHSYRDAKYYSRNYIRAIAPLWSSLNFSGLYESILTSQRKTILRYFNENKDSLFLKDAIKLKYKVSKNFININSVYRDYGDSVFKEELNYYRIPDTNSKRPNSEDDFKNVLWKYTQDRFKDIVDDCYHLQELFKQISDDNITRSNMKIQRKLFHIAILGVLIAIYSTNTEYFNNCIECFFNKYVEINIPRVKIKPTS